MKNVTHGRGSFSTTDDIADALVELDRAFRSADTVARVEIPVPGKAGETLWVHVTVGDRMPLVSSNDSGLEPEAPLPLLVPPGPVRHMPIDVQAIIDEGSFPYGHDWL